MTETFLFTSNFVQRDSIALNTLKLTARTLTEKVSISVDEFKHFECWIKNIKKMIDSVFYYICTSIVITWGYYYLHYKLSRVHINPVPSNKQNKNETNNTKTRKTSTKSVCRKVNKCNVWHKMFIFKSVDSSYKWYTSNKHSICLIFIWEYLLYQFIIRKLSMFTF